MTSIGNLFLSLLHSIFNILILLGSLTKSYVSKCNVRNVCNHCMYICMCRGIIFMHE